VVSTELAEPLGVTRSFVEHRHHPGIEPGDLLADLVGLARIGV
jgi:hypothetical protein